MSPWGKGTAKTKTLYVIMGKVELTPSNQLFSTLNIGKIISCPLNEDSEVCFETIPTVQPIADALGLPIDTTWYVTGASPFFLSLN